MNLVRAGDRSRLLLDGYPQTLATWHCIAQPFAKHFTGWPANLRECGESSKPEGRISFPGSGHSNRNASGRGNPWASSPPNRRTFPFPSRVAVTPTQAGSNRGPAVHFPVRASKSSVAETPERAWAPPRVPPTARTPPSAPQGSRRGAGSGRSGRVANPPTRHRRLRAVARGGQARESARACAVRWGSSPPSPACDLLARPPGRAAV